MHRRRFLDMSLSGVSAGLATATWAGSAQAVAVPFPIALQGESLVAWVNRTRGKWDEALYKCMLGFANEFKEGDEIVGVAAPSPAVRDQARQLLSQTTLEEIDAYATERDQLFEFIRRSVDESVRARIAGMTLGQLKEFLLVESEQAIHTMKSGLSSDVIACVVRLMTNEELIRVGANVFNPLPGTKLGARGYMGARIQPNSPTDHVDDIRWQVFDAFAFAVGDVLVGTNPVSSDADSVASVEKALQDILTTFGIQDVLPHCVLAHIDVQAEAEKRVPGCTALWFQSIAGNDACNTTFDITVDKMVRHAAQRKGKYGLYFETGQGADFTNGHGNGMDMVTLESRKYGFARALGQSIPRASSESGKAQQPWLHVNDVAGFIGPEVFRTREQLVRCCLEDIVMGKLHGLMIGLDICSTLHMDVSLEDLGWCIDQIMPANPGYLMALPTRLDPMLGYMTTGYHDHVHVRRKFGFRVEDRMWTFFKNLGVIDEAGKPTRHFADPSWVYLQYCRRRSDSRTDTEILDEAKIQMANVRKRGVFLADGYGEDESKLPPNLANEIEQIYTESKRSIWTEIPEEFQSRLPTAIGLKSQSKDRTDYILHPTSGEHLHVDSAAVIVRLKQSYQSRYNAQVVISDGLNALAVTTGDQLQRLLAGLDRELVRAGYAVAPQRLLLRSGRVRAGYRIGEQLFGGMEQNGLIVHVIGERPGSGHNTLSIYVTKESGAHWGVANRVDHNVTKVVSGIALTALPPEQAALDFAKLIA
jgi:ethanolamine ammonia-lyase large subunit